MSIRVAALFIHPLKSAAPVPVQHLALDELGARGDRRWLLVDNLGTAITQREAPAVARIRATYAEHDTLILRAPSMPELALDAPVEGRALQVRVWADEVAARDAGDHAAAWCSRAAGVECRLVWIDPRAERPLATKYAGPVDASGRRVAFTDGAPLLVLGQGSLDELNRRLALQDKPPVGVDRFRPNILLTGTAPHAEDSWLEVQIGDMRVGIGSTCPRCVITTIDQQEGRSAGTEPLRTLSTYRLLDGKAMFAVNATHAELGTISVGDELRVVQHKPTPEA